MTTASKAQYKQNLKKFRQALSGKYKVNPTTQSAYVVGDGHIKIDGHYYDATTSGIAGSTAKVVNIGRPAAAIYSTAEGGTVVSTGGGSGSSGGGGTVGGGAPIDAAYITLALNSALTNERVLTVSAPLSLSDGGGNNAVNLSVTTPPTLSVSSVNDAATGSHAITSSSAPGAATSLLKSDTDGSLTLPIYTATTRVRTPRIDTASGDLALEPAADLVLSPSGGDVVVNAVLSIPKPVSTSTYNALIRLQDTGTAADSATGIDWRNTTYSWDMARIAAVRRGSAADFHLAFSTATNGVLSEKMRLLHNGRLLIGTTTDNGYTLDVTGAIRAVTSVLTPLLTTASGNITIAPVGATTAIAGALTVSTTATVTTSVQTPLLTTASNVDLVINPAGTGSVQFPNDQKLRTSSFDSSFPINGWQINEVEGISGYSALTIGKIQADELAVRIFVADEVRVDRGDEYWTKSYGIVAENFVSPASIGGTVSVMFEDSPALVGAIFTNNDWVLLRKLEIDSGLTLFNLWGQVSSYVNNSDGTQSWTFTLRVGPTSEPITKGSLAIDFGASGAALIHLSVIDAAGAPYIKMRKWVTNPYEPANYTTYVQLGNLGSIGNSYYTPAGYGIYIRSTSAEDQFIVADDNGLQIRGADFKIYDGSDQTVGISSTDGSVKLGTNIASDATTNLDFNGTTGALSIKGNLSAADGDVIVNANGLNIQAFDSAGNWTDTAKILNFTSNPASPAVNNTVFAIRADRRTDTSPTRNDVYLSTRAGTTPGMQQAMLHLTASDDNTAYGTASVTLNVNSVTPTENEVQITSQTDAGASSWITLLGRTRTYHVQPIANDAYDLGTSSYYYNHAYIRNLHIDTIVGTPSYSHSHAASDITSGTLDLARIPATLTGKDADTLDGYHASSFALAGSSITSIIAGSGIGVSGTTTVTVSHADTSSATTINGSGGVAISGVGVDTYGHATSLASVNFDLRFMQTLTEGAGISVTGTAPSLTVAHADTSSQANVTGSGTTFVYGMTFDTYGHVQTVTTSDIGTALDSRFVNVAGDTMTGALLLPAGAVGTPSLAMATDSNTGLYWPSADTLSVAIGGVSRYSFADATLTAPFVTLSMSANLDSNHTLGRGIVGYAAATDTATFSHYDNNTSTNFGFAQYANGSVKVNAASPYTVEIGVGGVNTMAVAGERLYPRGTTEVHIGDSNRKFGTLHVGEIIATHLVAEEVITTIGGQIIVAPSAKLIADISAADGAGGSSDLVTNLVSYWSLEEASGTRNDAHSTNHLTDNNTVVSATGKIGTAASFTKANSEYLSIADNAALSVGDIDFYGSCWIYPTLDDGTPQTIASKGSSTVKAWAVNINWADNKIYLDVYTSGGSLTYMGSSGTITTNTWYFVEWWHDSVANQIGIAINGTSTTASYSTGVRDDTGAFMIGASHSGAVDRYYQGRIDDLGFWKNYIPDSTERTWLYNAGAGRNYSAISAYGSGDINIDIDRNSFASGTFLSMSGVTLLGVPKSEIFKLTSSYSSITGGYRYTATRALNSTTASDWYIGDALSSTGGAVGDGFINLTATRTIYDHYGPAITQYVRTGTSSWDDVVPVTVQGNMRGFADYSTDVYGFAVAKNLLLTPTTGLQGLTADATNGVRLFNTEIALYEGSTKFLGIDADDGIVIETNSSPSNGRRSISFNHGGVNRSYMGTWEASDINITSIATNPTAGLEQQIQIISFAHAAQIASVTLFADSTGQSQVYLYASPTANDSYIYLQTDGYISMSADLVKVFSDIDMFGNDILGIGTFGNWSDIVSFGSGWGNLGSGFRTAQYRKIGDIVQLRGVVKRTSGSVTTITTLPSGHRPSQQEPHKVDSANAHGRVDITTDGQVALLVGTATDYVSLNGIFFSVL